MVGMKMAEQNGIDVIDEEARLQQMPHGTWADINKEILVPGEHEH
jgi:hypothetical protein